jgi:hypothetical protein
MLGVVATDDDELTLTIEVEHVDDVEAPGSLLCRIGANLSSKQQTEDIKHQKRGDEERHDCSENR